MAVGRTFLFPAPLGILLFAILNLSLLCFLVTLASWAWVLSAKVTYIKVTTVSLQQSFKYLVTTLWPCLIICFISQMQPREH